MDGTLVKERFVTYKEFGDDDIVLSLRELTEQKYDVKDQLNMAEHDLINEEMGLKAKRQALLLVTDFKSKNITNQAGRDAYVEKQNIVKEYKEGIEVLKKRVEQFKGEYELICDTLSNYRLLIRLEISRREMVE
jgi:hypothetical protein